MSDFSFSTLTIGGGQNKEGDTTYSNSATLKKIMYAFTPITYVPDCFSRSTCVRSSQKTKGCARKKRIENQESGTREDRKACQDINKWLA